MGCSCKSVDLFNFGCKCGAFKFENSNHVWFNGVIYSIGKDADEAKKLAEDYLSDFQDYEPGWIIGNGWKNIPDNMSFPLLIEEDFDDEETRLASEWAAFYGPGFLAAI